jgi:hypothetical protein
MTYRQYANLESLNNAIFAYFKNSVKELKLVANGFVFRTIQISAARSCKELRTTIAKTWIKTGRWEAEKLR